MSAQMLLLFATAALALAVIPGPTMLLALSNGLRGGWRCALAGVAGACCGSAVLVAVVAAGLGALLAASEPLFEAMRCVGVIYLAWLAWGLWRGARKVVTPAAREGELAPRAAFARSAGVSLTNPKAIMFFAAFLPQFVVAGAPQGPQYAVLGTIFIGLDAAVMLLYAGAGRHALRWLSSAAQRWVQRGSAAAMLALAAGLALLRRPQS